MFTKDTHTHTHNGLWEAQGGRQYKHTQEL